MIDKIITQENIIRIQIIYIKKHCGCISSQCKSKTTGNQLKNGVFFLLLKNMKYFDQIVVIRNRMQKKKDIEIE